MTMRHNVDRLSTQGVRFIESQINLDNLYSINVRGKDLKENWLLESDRIKENMIRSTIQKFNEVSKDEDELLDLLRDLLESAGYPNGLPSSDTSRTSGEPSRAPEKWADRNSRSSENPVTFIKRVYADWLGLGLTRAHLRDLDLPLYNALATWTRRHGPGDLDLPTKKELNDRLLAG